MPSEMPRQTLIFIGRSGCGKGTQAKLMENYLNQHDPQRDIFYVQTGAKFREMIEGETHSNQLSRTIYERGGLQPEFLTVWVWSNELLQNAKPNQHMLFDGTPRKPFEALALSTALIDFYERESPKTIYLDVSEDWSIDRLRQRGRVDDVNIDNIRERMSWFHDDVMKTINYYEDHPSFEVLRIDGERSIEDVHKDVVKSVFGEVYPLATTS